MLYLRYLVAENAMMVWVVDYKDLQVFQSVATTLHLGRVSQQLHMSASTLSRRLSKIEQEVGACLIDRGVSPWQLTPAGELFRQYVEQTLSSWQQLRRNVSQHISDLAGSLTLYCSVTASYSVLADVLSRFREQYPRVDLRVHTGDAAESIARVEAGDADVVIAARPESLAAHLTFKTIAHSPLLFVAPKSINSVAALHHTPIDWSQVPMVLSEQGLARTRVNQWFQGQGIEPHVYAQVSGNEAIVSMVALGVGVGVVPELVLRNSPMGNRVRIMPIQPELEPFAIGLCARAERLSDPLVHALWKTAAL